MTATPEQDKLCKTLQALYPNLTDEEMIEAREKIDTYIEQTMLQYERIRQNPEEYKKFLALTSRDSSGYDESNQEPVITQLPPNP